MRFLLAIMIMISMAGAVDLQPGGNPALPSMTFPITPAGMCLDGTERLFSDYRAAGLSPVLLYDLPDAESQGHVWLAVPDGDSWLAVDSFWGPMTSESYYHADMSFTDIESMRNAFPRERMR